MTRFAELLDSTGLSQQEIADKIGVAQKTISRWKNGEVSMPLDKAAELSLAFGWSLNDLADIADEGSRVLLPREQELLDRFIALDAEAQDIVMRLVKYLDSAHK